jgi:hypothetical protein
VTAERASAILFAVVVAAAAVVLVVTQNVRDRLVVDQVEITNEIDPGGERPARIRFRLTEDEERATVAVIDRRGRVVETLAEDEPLGDYEIHRFRWAPEPDLDPGSYRVRLTLDSLGRRFLLPEEIDVRTSNG